MIESVKERWEAAYQAAEYRLMFESGTVILKIGHYDAAAEQKLLTETGLRAEWYIVTPCNPRSQMARAEMNLYYLDQMRFELGDSRAGTLFQALNHDTAGQWPDEPGFLLVDADRVWAMDLGRRFYQNAMVTARVGEPPRLLWLEP